MLNFKCRINQQDVHGNGLLLESRFIGCRLAGSDMWAS